MQNISSLSIQFYGLSSMKEEIVYLDYALKSLMMEGNNRQETRVAVGNVGLSDRSRRRKYTCFKRTK